MFFHTEALKHGLLIKWGLLDAPIKLRTYKHFFRGSATNAEVMGTLRTLPDASVIEPIVSSVRVLAPPCIVNARPGGITKARAPSPQDGNNLWTGSHPRVVMICLGLPGQVQPLGELP
jgi:hypothetical protein